MRGEVPRAVSAIRRARARRDDPLCPRCLVARKEHESRDGARLEVTARGNARVTRRRGRTSIETRQNACCWLLLEKTFFHPLGPDSPKSQADRPPGPRSTRTKRRPKRSHDCCVFSIRSRTIRVRALVLEDLFRLRRSCAALSWAASSPRSEPSSRRLCGALVGVSKRAGLIPTHPQSLKNDAARSAASSRSSTPRSGRWRGGDPAGEGGREEVSRTSRPRVRRRRLERKETLTFRGDDAKG